MKNRIATGEQAIAAARHLIEDNHHLRLDETKLAAYRAEAQRVEAAISHMWALCGGGYHWEVRVQFLVAQLVYLEARIGAAENLEKVRDIYAKMLGMNGALAHDPNSEERDGRAGLLQSRIKKFMESWFELYGVDDGRASERSQRAYEWVFFVPSAVNHTMQVYAEEQARTGKSRWDRAGDAEYVAGACREQGLTKGALRDAVRYVEWAKYEGVPGAPPKGGAVRGRVWLDAPHFESAILFPGSSVAPPAAPVEMPAMEAAAMEAAAMEAAATEAAATEAAATEEDESAPDVGVLMEALDATKLAVSGAGWYRSPPNEYVLPAAGAVVLPPNEYVLPAAGVQTGPPRRSPPPATASVAARLKRELRRLGVDERDSQVLLGPRRRAPRPVVPSSYS